MSALVPLIVFEDRWILGILKPSGMHTVSHSRGSADSVAGWLAQERSYLAGVSPKRGEAGLLNRLDFETSGLLLCAKDRGAWRELSSLQRAGHMRKRYLAVVEGLFRQRRRIEGLIGSRYRRSKKVEVRPAGKAAARYLPAWAEFEPLLVKEHEGCSVVRVCIGSGRRHQIRALAAFGGHPLVGDRLYGAASSPGSWGAEEELPQFLLHAESVEFRHPYTAAPMMVVAPAPRWLDGLREKTDSRAGN